MACASDVVGKPDKLKISEQLNCPICLEVYSSPRALACLHTYCHGCIHTYILKQAEKGPRMTTNECPLCRKPTTPPAPTRPPAEWAETLPINHALLPMLESLTAESESKPEILCGSCSAVGETTVATSFCGDCNMYQCVTCVNHHMKYPSTKKHKLVGLEMGKETGGQINLGKLEFCEIHTNKEIEYFCRDEDVLCCSSCAIVGHRKCQQVVEVQELGRDVKAGNKAKTLRTQLGTLQNQLGTIAVAMETNMSDIEQQAKSLPQTMKDIRDKIVQLLDKLVLKVSTDCAQLKKESDTHLSDQVFRCRSVMAAIASSCLLLESVLEHGSEAQVFITSHKLEEQVREYNKVLKEIYTDSSKLELHLDLDTVLTTLDQSASQTLARVSVNRGKHDARVMSTLQVPIAESDLHLLPRIQMQSSTRSQIQPFYTGAVYLPDKRLVVTDSVNSCCCLLDDNYTVTAEVKLDSSPSNLVVVGDHEVVVVLPHSNMLQPITIGSSLSLGQPVRCNRTPHCIATISRQEWLVGWDTGFGVVSPDGKEQTYMDMDTVGRQIKFGDWDRIAVDVGRGHVYQSSCNSHAVYCFRLTGEPVFTYSTDTMAWPRGMTTDVDGNLYIGGGTRNKNSRTLHQVTPLGKAIRVMDTDIYFLFTTCFHPDGDKMLVMRRLEDCTTFCVTKVTFVPPAGENKNTQ